MHCNVMCWVVQEGELLGAYGEWVPVDKAAEKPLSSSKASLTTGALAKATSTSGEALPEVGEQPALGDNDSVFPDPPQQVRSQGLLKLDMQRQDKTKQVAWLHSLSIGTTRLVATNQLMRTTFLAINMQRNSISFQLKAFIKSD